MGSNINALIARGLPAIDPAGDYAKLSDLALANQQKRLEIEQARQLFPLKAQAAQQLYQENQLKVQQAQRAQQSQQRIMQISQDPTLEGDPDKILPRLIGDPNVIPEHYWDFSKNVTGLHKDRTAQATSVADLAAKHQLHNSSLFAGVKAGGYQAPAFGGALHQAVTDKSLTEEQAKDIEFQHRTAPDPDAFLRNYVDSEIAKNTAVQTGVTTAAEGKLKQDADKKAVRTAEAIQASYELRDDAGVKAWKDNFKEFANLIPDTFKTDTPRLIQMRLGVPVKDQPTVEEKQSEVDWLKDPDRLPKLKAQIDSVIPPSKGPIYAYENNMATQAVGAARNQKDAQAAIKDSADRLGRFEVSQNLATAARDARPEPTGTLTMAEDAEGKPVLFNSRTGEVKAAPGIQKTGTYAKTTEPVQKALSYADNYLQSKVFTGTGDEALMEQFFELTKPSTGFRMSKQQIDMFKESRSLMEGLKGKAYHLATGKWFSDEQRQQIVDTMKQVAKAKLGSAGGGTAAPAAGGGKKDLSKTSTDELFQMLK